MLAEGQKTGGGGRGVFCRGSGAETGQSRCAEISPSPALEHSPGLGVLAHTRAPATCTTALCCLYSLFVLTFSSPGLLIQTDLMRASPLSPSSLLVGVFKNVKQVWSMKPSSSQIIPFNFLFDCLGFCRVGPRVGQSTTCLSSELQALWFF